MISVAFDQRIYSNYSILKRMLHCSFNDPPFPHPVLLMEKSSRYHQWQSELDEELKYLLVKNKLAKDDSL